jgi:hypothetical protein
MLSYLEMPPAEGTHESRGSQVLLCNEKYRLLRELVRTIHELNTLQSQQTRAIIDEDPDFSRFDLLLHDAQERKEAAKYRWMEHVESHGCGDAEKREWR